MNEFIKRKSYLVVMSITMTAILTISVLLFGVFSNSIFKYSFMAGVISTGLIPISLFSTAFYYQRKVVLGLRQLSFIRSEQISELSQNIVEAAKLTYDFTKYVPVAITILAMIIAVAIVPSAIGSEILQSRNQISVFLGCSAIAANLFLFFKMYNQVIFCHAQIKTESF